MSDARMDQRGTGVRSLHVQPLRFRVMVFGLPTGLLAFLVFLLTVTWRADHLTPAFIAFYLGFALLTAQATAMALLVAHRVRLSDEGIIANTLFAEITVEWKDIMVETVDRGDRESPQHLVLITGPRSQFIVLGWLQGFGRFVEELRTRSPERFAVMPLWKRIALLQWGV